MIRNLYEPTDCSHAIKSTCSEQFIVIQTDNVMHDVGPRFNAFHISVVILLLAFIFIYMKYNNL